MAELTFFHNSYIIISSTRRADTDLRLLKKFFETREGTHNTGFVQIILIGSTPKLKTKKSPSTKNLLYLIRTFQASFIDTNIYMYIDHSSFLVA